MWINHYSIISTIAAMVDANGCTHTYSLVDNDHAKVGVTDVGNNTVYTYLAGFDMNLSETSRRQPANLNLVGKYGTLDIILFPYDVANHASSAAAPPDVIYIKPCVHEGLNDREFAPARLVEEACAQSANRGVG